MRLKRLFQNRNTKAYLMELVIVILGISIAYQVNNYKERIVNNRLEQNALLNLQKEIQINIDEFESLAAYREGITQETTNFQKALQQDAISKDTAQKYLFKLVRTSTPDLQHQATTSYLASNYGTTNISLKNELLALQTYLQELTAISEAYNKLKAEDFIKYLRDEVDFSNTVIVSMNKINSLEFRNIIWNQLGYEVELNRLYKLSEEQLLKVEQSIELLLANE
ncbi:hypothetical protein [Roseivirga pacifica]|uniref:hypothetical protein n=1 Tax=Roseivirga pacifica TaxID=1267423 RepID=UPI002094B05A|nr:hypothetical protein [Roseivirga pacifica]MCO6358311.1 hypothetical protein [Roseivirga pacifica]MCO6366225.1 hypothetical protein [Roseivirga pacifica]MCO6369224.1 hypothetical protein [Roseivirga pacifica]MCO6374042.1 hypothetical protein [Roseivirga pacifica]MCO6378418.1 hypothetical protein [Roseivirga pacifica]